ncbi:MAG: GTP 3',8-cyclase MoaA [Candidatus Riflebacteria bacterium]|nr:GTP 3',8-cyclase MoaA [Candidatus Riflebacteria bacterium]
METNTRAVFEYLRLSVTDRCNLRCVYCMPAEGVPKLKHSQVMRYEEMLTIVRAAVAEGVFRVRVTGGEPLVRRGLTSFIAELARIPGVIDLALTTNGILLADRAYELANAGLKRINVSLDSLRPERFRAFTRGGEIGAVLRGIDSAIEAGLSPVKINVVLIPGENDDELFDFAALAMDKSIHVRFIERMPFSIAQPTSPIRQSKSDKEFVSQEYLMERLASRFSLTPAQESAAGGPAQMFSINGGSGRIGFISSRTNPFCRRCNRLRLTASGTLLPCLDADHGIDVHNLSKKEVGSVIRRLAEEKLAIGKSCPEFRRAGCQSLSDIGG